MTSLRLFFGNDNPIQDGDTVDEIKDGKMNRAIQWKCRYEEVLIQLAGEVIDVCMGSYASGNREQRERGLFNTHRAFKPLETQAVKQNSRGADAKRHLFHGCSALRIQQKANL